MSGKDPYGGIVGEMRKAARSVAPPTWCLGEVLTVSPLVIRGDGQELDGEDLLVNPALLPRGSRDISLVLSGGSVTGEAAGSGFSAQVESGSVEASFTLPQPPLATGDRVVLLPEGDQYLVLCKVVSP